MNTQATTSVTRDQIIASYQSVVDDIKQNNEYRMQNYFNCVDDYSFGNPYHAAADSSREYEARIKMNYSLETLEKGYCEIDSKVIVLTDLEGNQISVGARYGKFGLFFSTPTGCVGLPKKIKTLENKGYSVKVRVRKYKADFTGKVSGKGNAIFENIQILSEVFIEPQLNEEGNVINFEGKFIDWLYEQK
jgi:hypothetical protein